MGRTLREGPRLLHELSSFFHTQGYSVYMPYDTEISSEEIKKKDMDALSSCDFAVLQLDEVFLGVAQELGAARALVKPVVLITRSREIAAHNWIRGDKGIKCCQTREDVLKLLQSL